MNKKLEELKAQLALNEESRQSLVKQIAEIETTEQHANQIAAIKGKYFYYLDKANAETFIRVIDVPELNLIYCDLFCMLPNGYCYFQSNGKLDIERVFPFYLGITREYYFEGLAKMQLQLEKLNA